MRGRELTVNESKNGVQDDGCMVLSCVGLISTIDAVIDAHYGPIRLALTAGQVYDGHIAEPLLQMITKGAILLMSKASETHTLKEYVK